MSRPTPKAFADLLQSTVNEPGTISRARPGALIRAAPAQDRKVNHAAGS